MILLRVEFFWQIDPLYFPLIVCCIRLGRVPAMGYNSWYDWTCNMDEKQLRDTIDAMVSEGFVDLGYKYFNLDDCWSKGRKRIAPFLCTMCFQLYFRSLVTRHVFLYQHVVFGRKEFCRQVGVSAR